MFYANIVIKGRGRIVNFDYKETETIRSILDQNKFKFSPDAIYLNDMRVRESELDTPLVKLGQFWRWHKNTIKVGS